MTDDDLLRDTEWGGYEWEEAPDPTFVSEEELRARLEKLAKEEWAISYRRRVLRGRVDLIRAELVRCGGVSLSPEKMTRVLSGRGEDRGSSLGGRAVEPLS